MSCNGTKCTRCGSCDTENSEVDCYGVCIVKILECYNCGHIMARPDVKK